MESVLETVLRIYTGIFSENCSEDYTRNCFWKLLVSSPQHLISYRLLDVGIHLKGGNVNLIVLEIIYTASQ